MAEEKIALILVSPSSSHFLLKYVEQSVDDVSVAHKRRQMLLINVVNIYQHKIVLQCAKGYPFIYCSRVSINRAFRLSDSQRMLRLLRKPS